MNKHLPYVKGFISFTSLSLSTASIITNQFNVLVGTALSMGASFFGSVLYPIGDIKTRMGIQDKKHENDATRNLIPLQFLTTVTSPSPKSSYGLSGSFCSPYVLVTGAMFIGQITLSAIVFANEDRHWFDTSIDSYLTDVNAGITVLIHASHLRASTNLKAHLKEFEIEASELAEAERKWSAARVTALEQKVADDKKTQDDLKHNLDLEQQGRVHAEEEERSLRQNFGLEHGARLEERQLRIQAESGIERLETAVILAEILPLSSQPRLVTNDSTEQKANIQQGILNDRNTLFRNRSEPCIRSIRNEQEVISSNRQVDEHEPGIEVLPLRSSRQ